jgi:hypothetical protein
MERGELQAGNLGFCLAEAKSLLANGQKTLINAQAAMNAQTQQCEICGEGLRRKGRGTIVARTLFGKMPVDSPRFYRCACTATETLSRTSFSPLAEQLPERTVPDLQYLQAKWAASMSYGLTLETLRDVFPIGDALGKYAVRNNVARIARRLDAELRDEPTGSIQHESVAQTRRATTSANCKASLRNSSATSPPTARSSRTTASATESGNRSQRPSPSPPSIKSSPGASSKSSKCVGVTKTVITS